MNTVQGMADGLPLTEGARRATGVSGSHGTPGADLSAGLDVDTSARIVPNPEVSEKKTRRYLTAASKLRILDEADACGPGELGAYLRREGVYSSTLARWRKQRETGVLVALSPKKRGRRADPESPLQKKCSQLEVENERLKKRLRQAETIIDVQKKVSEMFGIGLGTEKRNGRT